MFFSVGELEGIVSVEILLDFVSILLEGVRLVGLVVDRVVEVLCVVLDCVIFWCVYLGIWVVVELGMMIDLDFVMFLFLYLRLLDVMF